MTSIDLQAKEIKPQRNTYTHVARYIGGDKPATRYQEATMGAQPTQNFHYRPTWDPQYELFDASRSAIACRLSCDLRPSASPSSTFA